MGIFGLGPVGLCATAFAVARGARVVGMDLQPERLRLARAMGAERVINVADQDVVAELMEMTGGRGLDAAADYSGSRWRSRRWWRRPASGRGWDWSASAIRSSWTPSAA